MMLSIDFRSRVIALSTLCLLITSSAYSQSLEKNTEAELSKTETLSGRLTQSTRQSTIAQSRQQTLSSSQPKSDYVFPSAHKRFNRYVKSTIGPSSLLRTSASAAIDQWSDSPEEWGQGARGYGKRFASNFGRNVIQQTTQYGLSEVLQLDTGFERSKRKGLWPRLEDALVQNITSRTRGGKRVISVPVIAGAYAGSIIPAETWFPDRYSYKDGLRSGTYSLAAGFGINLIREFVFNW